MIRIFCSPPRRGKSSCGAGLAVDAMTKDCFVRLNKCWSDVDRLRAGGFNVSYPREHIVYSDMKIIANVPNYYPFETWDIDVNDLRLPATEADAADIRFIPSHSLIFMDEVANDYSARDWKNLQRSVRQYFEDEGHWGLDFVFTCHTDTSIDKAIRELSVSVIALDGVELREKRGIGLFTFWHGTEYGSIDDYKNNVGGKPFQNFLRGNVFECYDSRFHSPLYLRGRENQDFSFDKHVVSGFDVRSVREHCARYGLK
jgi:hypothetical protein